MIFLQKGDGMSEYCKASRRVGQMLRIFLMITVTVFLLGGCASSTGSEKEETMGQVINYQELDRIINESLSKIGGWNRPRNELVGLSLTDLVKNLTEGSVTSEVVVLAYLSKILEMNAKYNAVVTLNAANALTQARLSDERRRNGLPVGKLEGVPFTIKDTFATQGVLTTAGHPSLINNVPEENAAMVQRLINAGAVLLGKTNTPALAMDMQTSNKVFGTTGNSYDPARTAGGSSGGASVAVALGFSPFEIGSDLAGSIRLPAALNGVTGLRPTFGLTSFRGHVPPRPGELNGVRRMAVTGPIGKNTADLAFLHPILAGPDKTDPALVPLQPASNNTMNPSQIRLAWRQEFGGVPVQEEIKQKIAAMAEELGRAGFILTQTEPKNFPYVKAWETWGAFVGMLGGYDQPNWIRSMGSFFASGSVANSPMQRKIVGPITVQGYMEALQAQQDCIDELELFLDDYDAWIVPVSSTTAFQHLKPTQTFGDFSLYDQGILVDGQKVPYYVATQSYTTPFSLTESPVVTIPIGKDSRGLPIGIQIVGKRFRDMDLLQIAAKMEEALTQNKIR